MTLRTLNYGNYGIFLIMGHAGFCPSAVFRVLYWGPPFSETPIYLPALFLRLFQPSPRVAQDAEGLGFRVSVLGGLRGDI